MVTLKTIGGKHIINLNGTEITVRNLRTAWRYIRMNRMVRDKLKGGEEA